MVKVCILQCDNRPLENTCIGLNSSINQLSSHHLNSKNLKCEYEFIKLDNKKYDLCLKTVKLYVVNEWLQSANADILIFLDTDAWIQNLDYLYQLLMNLSNDPMKHGCFSRDPYIQINTYINSGSFILKVNDFTKKMYTTIITRLNNDIRLNLYNKYSSRGWEDQFYVSNYVYEHRDDFFIFRPEILNTPHGILLRHNWLKNQKMINDMMKIYTRLHNTPVVEHRVNPENSFNFKNYYDKEIYPNVDEYAYEYKDNQE